MMDFYQNLPAKIDPIAFSIGSFSVRWYAVCYIIAFITASALVSWRLKRGEDREMFGTKKIREKIDIVSDCMLVGFLGMILGGRLGYVIFYNFSFFVENPKAIFSPFDELSGEYVGIFGMSYFGAILGILFFEYLFLKKRKIDFWKAADFFVPAISVAYFFGRVGNFLNGELFGKQTEFFLGMKFSGEFFLRHPSQLYQAFFEGALIFLLLWIFRNSAKFSGQIILAYFIAYSILRFGLEFLREIGPGELILGGILTKGQFLAVILGGISYWMYFQKSKKGDIIQYRS